MESESSTATKKRRKGLLPKVTVVLFFLCVLAVGASVFFFGKYQDVQRSEAASQRGLVDRLDHMVVLPNKNPTIVTVADKDKLSNQELASRVEDKDILLIFGDAKRLIVYRPSAEKVVDMLSFSSRQDLPDKNDSGDSGTKPSNETE